jgi:hypothetical protein
MDKLTTLLVGRRLVISPLYVDDALLAHIMFGDRAKQWLAIQPMLEREGFPEKKRAMAGLRYLPAALEFLERREGLRAGYAEDGPERFDP